MKLKIKGIEIELEQLPSGKFKKPDLANKYEGFRYSIAPLKQTCETVMVFQKPYLTGSCLHDTLALEAGDKTVACGALAINQNKVGISGGGTHCDNRDENGKCRGHNNAGQRTSGETIHADETEGGRYPSQTFVDSAAGEVLDGQSGVLITHQGKNSKFCGNSCFGIGGVGESQKSVGGSSKILHKCDFEKGEQDLMLYCPKVSGKERNAGLEGMPDKKMGHNTGMRCSLCGKWTVGTGCCECPKGERQEVWNSQKNNHPTVKPISLNERILRLFKTPNPQRICYPFAGSGSEIIGGHKAGFTDFTACELNPEYVEIAKARLKHWTGEEPKVSMLPATSTTPQPEPSPTPTASTPPVEAPNERYRRLCDEELDGKKLRPEDMAFLKNYKPS